MLWSTLINRASKHFIEVFIDVLGPSSQPLILSQRVPPLGRNHRVLVAIVNLAVFDAICLAWNHVTGSAVATRDMTASVDIRLLPADLVAESAAFILVSKAVSKLSRSSMAVWHNHATACRRHLCSLEHFIGCAINRMGLASHILS